MDTNFVILIVTISQILTVMANIQIPPSDLAVASGSDVTLNCTVSTTDALAWTKGSGTETQLYLSLDGKVSDANKYKVVGSSGVYDLTVMSTTPSDGDQYNCKLYTSPVTVASAKVMVFDPLTCGTMETTYMEGDDATVFCISLYGGPVAPSVMFHYNNESVSDVKQTPFSNSSGNYLTGEKTWTVTPEDDGNEVLCHVHLKTPEYNDNCTFNLNILYTPKNVTIFPGLNVHYVGEEMTCNATGNPKPDIMWENQNMTTDQIMGETFRVTSSMMGYNSWRCVASNVINDTMYNSTQDIDFHVVTGVRTTVGPISGSVHMTSSLFSTLIGGILMLFFRVL